MPRPSLISSLCVICLSVVSAAGWMGVRLDGPSPTRAASTSPVRPASGVDQGLTSEGRRRDAWQPSPVPAGVSGGQKAPTDTSRSAGNNDAAPDARRRDAWQPSPVPAQGSGAGNGTVARPLAVGAVQALPAAVPVVVPGRTDAGSVVPAGDASNAQPSGIWTVLSRAVSVIQDPSRDVARIVHLIANVITDTSGDGEPLSGMTYLNYDDLFTTERLEALYGKGVLPKRRGEWHYEQIDSRALGSSQQLLVWTPAGYESSVSKLPTLYLLHGAGGPGGFGVDEWLGYAITEDLDRLIDQRMIEPMIVVLPDGQQGYWTNQANGGPQWADFITEDVVPYVDAHFRTDARRERRAIGGLSMGAHGAMQIAYRRPELFSIAGAHSPTIRPFEDSPEFFGDQAHFRLYDPLTLVRTSNNAKRVLTWIDLGNEDKFRATTAEMRQALLAREAPLEFHVFQGEHEGWYWMGYLPEYLRFYSRALYSKTFTPDGAPDLEDDTVLLTASAQPGQ